MSSYHQTMIIGYVGKDPKTRVLQSDKTVCNFSVAVTDVWYQGDEKKEKTTWYDVAVWGRLAEICAEYVHKGMKVLVVGTVGVNAYTSIDGESRASLTLTAREVKFLGGGGQQRQEDFDETEYEGDIPF